MEGIISTVIFLLIITSIWAFTTWRKLKDMEKLKEWVTWSIHKDDFVRYNIPLWAHFKDAQIHAHIRDEYRISGEEEWEAARTLIERYQKNLTESYFDDRLLVLKESCKYAIQSKDYFIFMFYVYLCEHEPHDHDVVFRKMQYITYMYCKQHPDLQKNVPAWNEERLKKILDDDIAKKNPYLGDVTYDMVKQLTYDIGVPFVTAQRLINAERKDAGLPPIFFEENPIPKRYSGGIWDDPNIKINLRDE